MGKPGFGIVPNSALPNIILKYRRPDHQKIDFGEENFQKK
jgi:hypothetical protein